MRNILFSVGMLFCITVASHLAMAEEETASADPKVAQLLYVGSTEALIGLTPQTFDFGLGCELLPLPWTDVTAKQATTWVAGTIVAGDKSWNLLTFPMSVAELNRLSDEEKSKLLGKILDHPIGKKYFPNGNAEIRTTVSLFSPRKLSELLHGNRSAETDAFVVVVETDFPIEYWDLSHFPEICAYVSDQCYIGSYHDETVRVPGEESNISPEDASSTLCGVRWDDDSYMFFIDDMLDISALKVEARNARLSCRSPYRAEGFIDRDSLLVAWHRFFAEEIGLHHYVVRGGTSLIPAESRDDDRIYNFKYWAGCLHSKGKDLGKFQQVFQKGGIIFASPLQEELPPEEGVPSAEEINAANQALWKSLEPLFDEIAAKITADGYGEPIDFGAKHEDEMLLFALAFKPGENEPVIDWNRLSEIDLAWIQWPNPYMEEERIPSFRFDVKEAGQWQDVVFSTINCELIAEKNGRITIMLGQGPGMICGAVPLPLEEDSDDAEIAPEVMRAALEKCLERNAGESAVDVREYNNLSFFKFENDDQKFSFWSICEKNAHAFNTSMGFRVSHETSGMLAQIAQMVFGSSLVKSGMTAQP